MTSPVGLWALLAARLELLPEPEVLDTALGSEQDVRETVAAFLASAQAAELDHDLAGALVTVFADAAALSDRTAIGFGPISLGGFLLDEFIETVELTESEVAHVPAVLKAWAEFTNERRGFGEEGLRHWQRALPQLSKAFIEVYLDEDNADLREEAEAVPVREYQVCAGTDLSELLQQILDEAKGEGEVEDADDDDVEWVREPGSADSPDTEGR